MNERIRLLAEQAGYTKDMFGVGHWDMPECKKFAQLIVAECMSVAVNKDSGYMHPADVAGYMAAGRSTAAQMIREHFGVEQ